MFTVVSGSGESSLVHGSMPASAGAVFVDQGGVRGSLRSNPTTYSSVLDPLRSAFANANGVKPALFSANSEGACPGCNGVGLHLADVAQLLALLDRLVDAGKSVIVIEHHQAVMAHADWIIDLGPGAGHEGGRIVFEGPPAALVKARSTLTGQHLATHIGK